MNNIHKIIRELSYFFGTDVNNRCAVFIKLFVLKSDKYNYTEEFINSCITTQDGLNNLNHNMTDFIIDTAFHHRNICKQNRSTIKILINNVYKKWWSLEEFSRKFYRKYLTVEKYDCLPEKWIPENENQYSTMSNSMLNFEFFRITLRALETLETSVMPNMKGPLFISLIPKISGFNKVCYTNNHSQIKCIKSESADMLKEIYLCVYNSLNIIPDLPEVVSYSDKKFYIDINKLMKKLEKNNTQSGGNININNNNIVNTYQIWKIFVAEMVDDLRKYNKKFADYGEISRLLFEFGQIEEELRETKKYLEEYNKYIELFGDFNKEIVTGQDIKDYVDKYNKLENEHNNYEYQIMEIVDDLYKKIHIPAKSKQLNIE